MAKKTTRKLTISLPVADSVRLNMMAKVLGVSPQRVAKVAIQQYTGFLEKEMNEKAKGYLAKLKEQGVTVSIRGVEHGE